MYEVALGGPGGLSTDRQFLIGDENSLKIVKSKTFEAAGSCAQPKNIVPFNHFSMYLGLTSTLQKHLKFDIFMIFYHFIAFDLTPNRQNRE